VLQQTLVRDQSEARVYAGCAAHLQMWRVASIRSCAPALVQRRQQLREAGIVLRRVLRQKPACRSAMISHWRHAGALVAKSLYTTVHGASSKTGMHLSTTAAAQMCVSTALGQAQPMQETGTATAGASVCGLPKKSKSAEEQAAAPVQRHGRRQPDRPVRAVLPRRVAPVRSTTAGVSVPQRVPLALHRPALQHRRAGRRRQVRRHAPAPKRAAQDAGAGGLEAARGGADGRPQPRAPRRDILLRQAQHLRVAGPQRLRRASQKVSLVGSSVTARRRLLPGSSASALSLKSASRQQNVSNNVAGITMNRDNDEPR